MIIALNVMQGLLGAVFLITGSIKLMLPPDKIYKLVPKAFPLTFIRVLAGLEIAGAIGMGLSIMLTKWPILPGLIALGMGMILLGAVFIHGSRREWSKVPFISIMLICCAILAFFRL